MIKVFHISRSFDSAVDGGIAMAVKAIVRAQSRNPLLSVKWIATDSLSVFSLIRLFFCLAFNQNCILHVHGLWFLGFLTHPFMPCSVVISPHGMLNPEALLFSFRKKVLFLRSFLRYIYFHGVLFFCPNSVEKDYICSELRFAPICKIVPFPIFFPKISSSYNPPWSKSLPSNARVVLYFGRFHPIKNIPNLVKSWSHLTEHSLVPVNAYLVFVGFGDSSLIFCSLPPLSNPIDHRILVLPPVFGNEKFDCIASSECVVLPSLSECMPMSVLESFSVGKHALLSDRCNLQDSYEMGASLIFSPSFTDICNAFISYFSITEQEIERMNSNARAYIRLNHNPTFFAEYSLACYSSFLAGKC